MRYWTTPPQPRQAGTRTTMTITFTQDNNTETPFLGLAPFLRASVGGADLRPLGQKMLEQAGQNATDAELWMNLATVVQCFGQRDVGLSIQSLALQQQRIYRLAAASQPAKVRLLQLSVPGDISTNTPLDCLLENCEVDLIYYYVTPGDPLSLPIPEHDALFVAICEADENRNALSALEQALAHWPKPVINKPQYIPPTGREAASRLLQDAPGLLIPPTLHAPRALLQDIAAGKVLLAEQYAGCDVPIIVRPVGSHAGRDLAKIESADELAAYLAKVADDEFFISPFIDYSGKDGLFRKYRVVLVDGKPYASHMGISTNWMIHYVNAGMYEDASKREEERNFMEHFDDFAHHHRAALDAIYQRTHLDYVCIDCAETQDGQLLIFEVDHTMVVHAMDPEDMFPYKQVHMEKVRTAFLDFLFRLTNK
jgi:glutathione synthase/RimK-type ligase-like ATP-grasp enzyme